MHNDESIWNCLEFSCSYKVEVKQPKAAFCRNPYNVTGTCSRVTCPLANSEYATVIEEEGIAYLYMKTVERAHSPKNLWERVKLSRNFLQALEQISKHLEFWPDHMINRCKQRLTKIRQMLIRMRKLSMRDGTRLVAIKKKTEKREMTRELKAEAAAKVDLAIEKELLERLKQGTYGDIYNFPQKQFQSALDNGELEKEDEKEDESETEFVEDMGEDDDFEEDDLDVDKVEEVELEGQTGLADLEDLDEVAGGAAKPRKKRRQGPKVELEYEEEMEAR
mmetsp:Transcript_74150/g.217596  ORF Transcript_74150/g.217596 Transcript_74150/m.217596 type:complete len:278 (-) Transcript_74150:93-926(-)